MQADSENPFKYWIPAEKLLLCIRGTCPVHRLLTKVHPGDGLIFYGLMFQLIIQYIPVNTAL